jgi:alcohol dehydrogenase class IV
MELAATAERLLREWRGDAYAFGFEVLEDTGRLAAGFGKKALLVANPSAWLAPAVEKVAQSLAEAGVKVIAKCAGTRPNTPFEDVYRIQDAIESSKPNVIVVIGAGSTIDAVKAAAALAAVTPGVHDVAPLFGIGKVSERLAGRRLTPLVAVETAASSASHLTKYSNVTDAAASQKKLIIDNAVIPPAAVFDYALTVSSSKDLTADGAFDGISHSLEVYYGAKGPLLDKVEEIALTGIDLILSSVRTAVTIPYNLDARYRIGLGTDLGGCAIMSGSTSGGHLTSFSLVDVATHGRATAVMNPYYTVLFANAIERQLRALAPLYERAGHLKSDVSRLAGRDLALAVAEAMLSFVHSFGAPTSLRGLPGFSETHIERALAAAKDPSLDSKLRAMPVPLAASMIETYMRPVLEAAAAGDLTKVKTIT